MNQARDISVASVLSHQAPPRIAVVGGGMAGLTCARELSLRGYEPVVFEGEDRLGGRCSSRATRIGLFDDAAQCIQGITRLPSYTVQRPGELAALHPWTVPATPAEDQRNGRDWDKAEEDHIARTLKPLGAVGVPSMLALANAIARPLDVRLSTPIGHAVRRGTQWVLHGPEGEIDEDFEALVLAVPAPLALPLAIESAALSAALRKVRFCSRWVLMLGTERSIGLPGYREFHGSPIERVAAMHSKPGRPAGGAQRWFIEADQRWSMQHEHDDADTVADLLLDNFRAHAGRAVVPNYLCAHQWRYAFVDAPATMPDYLNCLWDKGARLGVCGDSVVASQVDRVHSSGVAMARAVVSGASLGRDRKAMTALEHARSRGLEAHA